MRNASPRTNCPRSRYSLLGIGLAALVLIGLMALLADARSASADGSVIYVDHAAGGDNNGSSWQHAYTTLQAALDTAAYGDEIWVAAGVYTPTNVADRTATYQMVPGVALYGGFAATETLRAERDWETHLTVLSGDLDGDDLTDPRGVVTTTVHISGTNAYHVVSANSGVTETAVLDGFVLTAGQATGGTAPQNRGGGLYNDGGRPTLANLRFSGNLASTEGGGMATVNGSPTLDGVRFENNQSNGNGGGLIINGGGPALVGVEFEGNQSSGSGGGLYNTGSSPTLEAVIMRGNRTNGSWTYGGGMYSSGGSPRLTNGLLSGNYASGYGGGLYTTGGVARLNGVTVSGNGAWYDGGLSGSGLEMVNSIVWGNSGTQIGAGGATVSYSLVQGGYAGVGNLDLDPLFVAPLEASVAPTTAGNYRLRHASPAIDAGNTVSVTASSDLDGLARVVDDEVDMGAYEYQAYTLTVNQVGEGEVAEWPGRPTYTYLDQVVLTATAESGWTFAGWSGDVVSGDNPLALTLTGHTVVTATFSQQAYTLTVNLAPAAGGAVEVVPEQASYLYGQVITLTATANPGWTFVGWSGDVVSTANPLTITITSDTFIIATFSSYRVYLPLVVRGSQ